VSSGQGVLRALLVDDEALSRLRMRSLLADCNDPTVSVVGEAADAVAALSFLRIHELDLVLLDVAMPGMDGTELAAEISRLDRPPAVVFVTAHAEHAVRAFELDAVDYLTKPVRAERLQSALKKVAHRAASLGAVTDDPVLVISDRGRIQRIPVSQAIFFKAELKYVTLRTAQHSHVLDESLTDLEQRLGSRFIRIHRNALVARNAVRGLERRVMPAEGDEEPGERWAVRLAPIDEWFVVSRRHLASVREALENGVL
jgi:two-component system response regulator AlgR